LEDIGLGLGLGLGKDPLPILNNNMGAIATPLHIMQLA
jgi:hypothetical protein